MIEISTKTKKFRQTYWGNNPTIWIIRFENWIWNWSKRNCAESKIDIGRGPVVNVIITSGTLKKGDYFVSGSKWGKVRAILNDQGKNIEVANPSTPIEVLGINGASNSEMTLLFKIRKRS